MKKAIILFVLLVCVSHSFAQFKLSGKIKNYSGHDELKINIPLVFSYNDANSIKIPVSKNGSFSIILPIKQPKFANLIFQQNFHLLLLDAGKNLQLTLTENDKRLTNLKGTAAAENNLLQTANLEEAPGFLKDDSGIESLSATALYNNLVKPYFGANDRKIILINRSAIGQKQKKLIIAEAKYITYNNVFELTLLGRQKNVNIDNLIINISDKINVQPEALPAGPQYYLFANNYAGYKQIKAYQQVKAANLKPNQLLPGYTLTIAAAKSASAKYGDNYLRWLSVKQFSPAAVAEQLGYQYIINAVFSKNAMLANVLTSEFASKFPNSIHSREIKKALKKLSK